MKNLLLIFLLANILYFVWSAFTEKDEPAGTEIVAERDLGPPLEVAPNVDTTDSVTAVLAADDAAALQATTGASCATIGPFTAMSDADTAALEYSGEGLRAVQRSANVEMFIGHWVQIRNVPDLQTANGMLATLADGGLTDAYYVETELLISLGLFGDVAGAEKIELQAKSLDLPAEILPRTSDRLAYFVDVRLPPGRGASAIVDRFGEDKVALRDAATCPP